MKFLEHIAINPEVNLIKGKAYPFIDMASLSTHSREPDCISEKIWGTGVKFQQGDTVIARIEPCLQNGKKFYCKNVHKGFGSTEYLVFRPKDETVNSVFLYYFMQQNFIRQTMIKSMSGATGRQRVNNAIFHELEISLPPLETQQKIASILSAYDDLIENNRRQIKLLEEAAQRLYKEWFVDLRFPGHENVKIINGVPEGWEKHKLSELILVLRRGISPIYNKNGKYRVISQKCIRTSIMNIEEARRQEKNYLNDCNLQDADTVICSTGTGTLGRVGQVYGDYINTTFDSHVTLVRAEHYKNFIYLSIKKQEHFLMNMGRGSTNQQELYKSVIENLDIMTPHMFLLEQFEQLVSAIHAKIAKVNDQNMIAKEARDRLLPKLMSDEIEV